MAGYQRSGFRSGKRGGLVLRDLIGMGLPRLRRANADQNSDKRANRPRAISLGHRGIAIVANTLIDFFEKTVVLVGHARFLPTLSLEPRESAEPSPSNAAAR